MTILKLWGFSKLRDAAEGLKAKGLFFPPRGTA